MECCSCSSSFGSMGLFCGNGIVFSSPKSMPYRVCLNAKSDHSLKPNQSIGLDFLSSFQKCNDKLKAALEFSPKRLQWHSSVISCDSPQNTEFPKFYGRRDKKPFPVPIVELRRSARERVKKMRGQPKRPFLPPKNGMLVKNLIPVAYDVYNERIKLINNLKKLLKVVRVHACRWCNEVHVGPTPHPFRTCRGQNSAQRKGVHDWGHPIVDDVFPPTEAYHLHDRLARRILHEQRFSIPRIPALVELCIQAGVDVPEFPTKRRRKPIIRINKTEFVDADESELPDPTRSLDLPPLLTEVRDYLVEAPSGKDEIALLGEETLGSWEKVRGGALRLMKLYRVRVCGYCPEVHVGADAGHKAQNCGAHKHQQRNGQHGWQSAVLDDLIPPRYVWHVPDVNGPPMQRELRNFYGQAPAVVEICFQAGAQIPDHYRGTMRLDIGIPSDPKEAEMVV